MYDKCWKHYKTPESSYELRNVNFSHSKLFTSALSFHLTGSVWTPRKPRRSRNGEHQRMSKMSKPSWDSPIFTDDSLGDFPLWPAPYLRLLEKIPHLHGHRQPRTRFKPLSWPSPPHQSYNISTRKNQSSSKLMPPISSLRVYCHNMTTTIDYTPLHFSPKSTHRPNAT